MSHINQNVVTGCLIGTIGMIALTSSFGCPAGSSVYYYAGPAPITASVAATSSLIVGDVGSAAAVITGATGDLTYQWSISSPGLIVGSSSDLTVSFGSTTAGGVTLAVTVTDSGTGTSATSAVQVTFQGPSETPAPLTVDAGADRTVAVDDTVLLLGSVSGGVSGYAFAWRQASGSVQTIKPDFADGTSAITVIGTTPGSTVFELIVGDSAGTIATDTVQVVVTAPPG